MVFALVIAALAAIACTVYLCIKVLPAKYDGTFSKTIFQQIHDYFNFKKLYLESVLKVIFTLATVACVVGGIAVATVGNLFQLFGNIADAINYDYFGSWIWSQLFINLFGGIAIAALGPIVLRLVYEGILMFIFLVKNVIEINNKMKSADNKPKEIAPEETTVE